MKFCSNCGKQIDDGLAFCPYCGAQQPQQQQPQQQYQPQQQQYQPQPQPQQQPKKASKGGIIFTVIAVICFVAVILLIGARQEAEERLHERLQNSIPTPNPALQAASDSIRLVGTWVNEGANEMSITYTFSTGGVGSQVMSYRGEPLTEPVEFTWKILEKGQLQLESNVNTVVVEYSISSDGKTLSLPYWNENKMDKFIKQ